MTAYRIIAWHQCHETFETNRLIEGLKWIAFPTYHDRGGFRRLMRLDDGPLVYVAYVLMVQISAKLPRTHRGWLINRDGVPLDTEDLSDRTGAPAGIFQRALEVLSESRHRINWLALQELPPDLRESAETCGNLLPTGPDRTVHDRTLPGPVLQPSPSRRETPTRTATADPPVRAGAMRSRGRDRAGPVGDVEARLARQQTQEPFCAWFRSCIGLNCRLEAAEVNEQRGSLDAVANRLWRCEQRAALGARLVALAEEKHRLCRRQPVAGKENNPWKLWQSAANKLLAKHGL